MKMKKLCNLYSNCTALHEDDTIIKICLLLQVKECVQKKKKRSSFVSIQSKKMQETIKGKKKRNSDDVSKEGYSCSSKSRKSNNVIHNGVISTIHYSNEDNVMTQENELHDVLQDIS